MQCSSTHRNRRPITLAIACLIAAGVASGWASADGTRPNTASSDQLASEATPSGTQPPVDDRLSPEEVAAAESRFPSQRQEIELHGWTIRVDERLLRSDGSTDANVALGTQTLRFLEAKLFDITLVVPDERLQQLRRTRIVLDLNCGDLDNMQYHPSARWLTANGYQADLEKCVHIPVASQLVRPRNVREQPWVILHELAHAFHDTVLGFDHAAIRAAFERYRDSGRGEQTLLFNGRRTQHYALTNEKEFFAEMTEALFGSNDFFPFNRAELMHEDRALYLLMCEIWQVNP